LTDADGQADRVQAKRRLDLDAVAPELRVPSMSATSRRFP
jgi:hypothetical protein